MDSHVFEPLAGGLLTGAPPVFTADSRYVFVPLGAAVRIVRADTGVVVRVLQTPKTVTALCLNPQNSLQLLTASADGSLCLWDFEEATCLKTYTAPREILHIFPTVSAETGELNLIWVTETGREHKQAAYRRVLKSGDDVLDLTKDAVKLLEVQRSGHWAYHAAAQALLAVAEKQVQIALLESHVTHRFSWNAALRRVAAHPTEPYFATADDTGKIVLWRGALRPEQAPKYVTSTLHWHAHAVDALCFTHSGSHLLSGGQEAVLVLWHLGTQKKRFLPRLGGPLRQIATSPDDTLYAVSVDDNSLKVLDAATLDPRGIVKAIRRDPSAGPDAVAPTTMLTDPRSGALVMPGATGALQVYDALRDVHLRDVQVVPRTYLSGTDKEPVHAAIVQHVAFAQNGTLLATVDARPWVKAVADARLKLWQFDSDSQSFAQVTRVEPPHEGKVTGLAGHSQRALFVTTSTDRTFKLWTRASNDNDDGKSNNQGTGLQSGWICAAVVDYHNQPCHGCAMSRDGSLLALLTKQCVSLWEPVTCNLKRTIPMSTQVRNAVFVDAAASMLVDTAERLQIVSLLSCRAVWSSSKAAKCYAVHPTRPEFAAAFVEGNWTMVRVFHISRGGNVAQVGAAKWRGSAGQLQALTYVQAPSQATPHYLVGLGSKLSVAICRAAADEHAPRALAASELRAPMYSSRIEEVDAMTQRFRNVFGLSAGATSGGAAVGPGSTTTRPSGVAAILPSETANADALLDAPAHMMAPATLIAERYLHLTLMNALGPAPELVEAESHQRSKSSSSGFGAGASEDNQAMDVETPAAGGASYVPTAESMAYLKDTFRLGQVISAPMVPWVAEAEALLAAAPHETEADSEMKVEVEAGSGEDADDCEDAGADKKEEVESEDDDVPMQPVEAAATPKSARKKSPAGSKQAANGSVSKGKTGTPLVASHRAKKNAAGSAAATPNGSRSSNNGHSKQASPKTPAGTVRGSAAKPNTTVKLAGVHGKSKLASSFSPVSVANGRKSHSE